jgi:hypothetical protein
MSDLSDLSDPLLYVTDFDVDYILDEFDAGPRNLIFLVKWKVMNRSWNQLCPIYLIDYVLSMHCKMTPKLEATVMLS